MPVTHYRWNSVTDNILCEQDEDGNLLATYTHEPSLYGELISQNRGGDMSYYHFDGQGSTRALTDENQNVTDTYTYSAFGDEVERTGTTQNRFGYNGVLGYYANPNLNVTSFRGRTYQASVGRWLSPNRMLTLSLNAYYEIPLPGDYCFIGGLDLLTDPACAAHTPYGLVCYSLTEARRCYYALKLAAWKISKEQPCAAALMRNFLDPSRTIDPYCPQECRKAIVQSPWFNDILRGMVDRAFWNTELLACDTDYELKASDFYGGKCRDPFLSVDDDVSEDLKIALGAVDSAHFELEGRYLCSSRGKDCCCRCWSEVTARAIVTDKYDFITTLAKGTLVLGQLARCAAILEDFSNRFGHEWGKTFTTKCYVAVKEANSWRLC